MHMRHAALLALATIATCARSGANLLLTDDLPARNGSTTESPVHSFACDVAFNSDDVFLGASYMYSFWNSPGIAAVVRGYGRPYEKDVLVPAGPGVYYHLHERRYGVGFGVDFRYDTGQLFELFATLLIDYSWADYAGTLRTSDEWVFPTMNAGLAIPLSLSDSFGMAVRGAYQYSAFDTISRHRAYVSLVFSLY